MDVYSYISYKFVIQNRTVIGIVIIRPVHNITIYTIPGKAIAIAT